MIAKILRDNEIEFHTLIYPAVYIWKKHLEEILSSNEYPKIIKATDRSTMLNLMVEQIYALLRHYLRRIKQAAII